MTHLADDDIEEIRRSLRVYLEKDLWPEQMENLVRENLRLQERAFAGRFFAFWEPYGYWAFPALLLWGLL